MTKIETQTGCKAILNGGVSRVSVASKGRSTITAPLFHFVNEALTDACD
jgi:hypothetical protein